MARSRQTAFIKNKSLVFSVTNSFEKSNFYQAHLM